MQKFQPRKSLTVEGQGNHGNIRSQASARPFLFLALGGCYEPSPPQTLVENHKTANWFLRQGDEGKQRRCSGESTLLPSMWFGPGSNPGLWRMPYVSWVCCWFSPGTPVFPLLKNQHFRGTPRHVSTKVLRESTNYNFFIYEEVIKRKKRKKLFKQIYIYIFLFLCLLFERLGVLLFSASYRKIPKISPGAYIFQRPLLRGIFLEGLIYEGKFSFQNRLG